MAKHTVTLIPGDGIGLETTAAMRRVVEACGVDIEWEIAEAGAHMMDSCGTPLPEATIEAVRGSHYHSCWYWLSQRKCCTSQNAEPKCLSPSRAFDSWCWRSLSRC